MDLLEGKVNNQTLVPCTPKGIMSMMEYYGIEVAGKNVVIVGRSMIVGKPMSLLITNANGTATLCHSRTKNLADHTQRADIIIAAVGIAGFIGKEHLNENKKQILIDVGINRTDDGKLVVSVSDVFNSDIIYP